MLQNILLEALYKSTYNKPWEYLLWFVILYHRLFLKQPFYDISHILIIDICEAGLYIVLAKIEKVV